MVAPFGAVDAARTDPAAARVKSANHRKSPRRVPSQGARLTMRDATGCATAAFDRLNRTAAAGAMLCGVVRGGDGLCDRCQLRAALVRQRPIPRHPEVVLAPRRDRSIPRRTRAQADKGLQRERHRRSCAMTSSDV